MPPDNKTSEKSLREKVNTVPGTILVATVLCVTCSLVVAGAAVGLKSTIEANKTLDRQKNVVMAAGLLKKDELTAKRVNELFAEGGTIRKELIDLETGKPVDLDEVKIDLNTYDPREAAKNPKFSVKIPADADDAGIKRREKYAYVYKVVGKSGELNQIVIPIYGKGLWSTLYGFIALEKNINTVDGITYYDHGETPGLGAEIQNPDWQAKWVDKSVYDDGQVELSVIKGAVDSTSDQAAYQVDGLSGATITSNGVTNMIHYWLGPNAFGPYLDTLRSNLNSSNSDSQKAAVLRVPASGGTNG
ncbi:Na(+)-translocating NADH-quinone reductase subunit C [Adhaeretor mobilis]|uniref:Na(+)-translocating NADH-quinone reductase subunit C n=1 Tax=Adhaeretor mobilis TaxID=1930276 RepID=A0A517MVV8_9BACT|nr:Na(+)-translocating NADH-quinone reductase subunit C [Adhaeretor mobilis]QDS99015.1 Na(+)-translocating NADH-quinone reductase subunit C [Adhaeretor mobilis]